LDDLNDYILPSPERPVASDPSERQEIMGFVQINDESSGRPVDRLEVTAYNYV
jgi:hypothetical protein